MRDQLATIRWTGLARSVRLGDTPPRPPRTAAASAVPRRTAPCRLASMATPSQATGKP